MIESKLKYLALGDSYTIGESVSINESFPIQLANKLKLFNIHTTIVAKTGWTSDELIKGIENSELNDNFDLVSILIGVNNQYRNRDVNDFKLDYKTLILKAINFAKGDKNKVFLLSIPDYGHTPFGEENQIIISREIDKYNNHCENIATEMGIKYFNITNISRLAKFDKILISTDDLHPSAEMYKLWVESFYEEIISTLSK